MPTKTKKISQRHQMKIVSTRRHNNRMKVVMYLKL